MTIEYQAQVGHDIKPFSIVCSDKQKDCFGVIDPEAGSFVSGDFVISTSAEFPSAKGFIEDYGKTVIWCNTSNILFTDIVVDGVEYWYKIPVRDVVYDKIFVDGIEWNIRSSDFIYTNSTKCVVEYFSNDASVLTVEALSYPVYTNRYRQDLYYAVGTDNKTYIISKSDNRLQIVVNGTGLKWKFSSPQVLHIDKRSNTLFWNQAIFNIGNQIVDFSKEKFSTFTVKDELHIADSRQHTLYLAHDKLIHTSVQVSIGNTTSYAPLDSEYVLSFALNGGIDITSLNLNDGDKIYISYRYVTPTHNKVTVDEIDNRYSLIDLYLYNSNVEYLVRTEDRITVSPEIELNIGAVVATLSETLDTIEYTVDGNDVNLIDGFYENIMEECYNQISDIINEDAIQIGSLEVFRNNKAVDAITFCRYATLKDYVYEYNVVHKYGAAVCIFGDTTNSLKDIALPLSTDAVVFSTAILLPTNIINGSTFTIDVSIIDETAALSIDLIEDPNIAKFALDKNYTPCQNYTLEYGSIISIYINGVLVDDYDGAYIAEDNMLYITNTGITNMDESTIIKVSFKPTVQVNV